MQTNVKIIYAFFIVLIFYFLFRKTFESFQSYDYPWKINNNWSWNWWRRWFHRPRHRLRNIWEPRCPSGCSWTGSRYACPNGNNCYGNYCCKYDFECKECSFAYDGTRG
jgi:hypothetical protein